MALTWDEFKKLMIEEFCPRSEMRKLEEEFWVLAQDSGENRIYTTRYYELCLLVPHMVPDLTRRIEKYCLGLPMQIQDSVLSSKPATLEEAVRFAATLTDNHVKAGTLHRKGEKKSTVAAITNPKPDSSGRKRKANTQNYASVTPAQPINQVAPATQFPAKKAYVGPHPKCDICHFHHPANSPCRICNKCKRLGHTQEYCRNSGNIQAHIQGQNVIQNTPSITVKACFQCGDPTHFKNECPLLANAINATAKGRVYAITASETQDNTEEADT